MSSPQGPCVLVPIKQRERCKTRLASELAPQRRLALVRSMLSAVLAAARAARTVHEVMVVSPERDTVAAEIAVVNDSGESLNGALAQAHETLWNRGWRQFVVLPADLPRISAGDIDVLVRAGRPGGFALAPDATGSGTNGLYITSPPPFRFRFGADSRRRHLEEAQRLGLAPRLVHLRGLAFDLDTPADLAEWQLDRPQLDRQQFDPPGGGQPWPLSLRS